MYWCNRQGPLISATLRIQSPIMASEPIDALICCLMVTEDQCPCPSPDG